MVYWYIFRGIVLVSFFLSLFSMSVGFFDTFNSPDERANYSVASAFARDGVFYVEEPANLVLQGVVHPRSFYPLGDRLYGRSFLGLPLTLGVVGRAFGEVAMYFVTPLLAVLCVMAFWDSVRRFSKDSLFADIAAGFLLLHPGFWYYGARVMMHNVGFLSLLVLSFWFVVARPFSRKRVGGSFVDFGLSGALFVLAVAFRASEIVWVLPALCLIVFFSRASVSVRRMGCWVFGAFLVALPFAFLHADLYGAPWRVGYQVMADAPAFLLPSAEPVEPQGRFALVLRIVLPFGLAERAIARHVWQYALALYPWVSISALVGFGAWFFRRKEVPAFPWQQVLAVLVVVAGWLFVAYGSWTFHDNPDPRLFTLGNSYVRYWLPVFLLMAPFAALPVWLVARSIRREVFRYGFVLISFLLVASCSFQLVAFGHDGFFPTRAALASFEEKQAFVLSATEEEAILIVDRSDKFIFPHRSVVVPLRSDVTYAVLPLMVEYAPVYYFGITLPQIDLDYLNDVKVAGDLLRFEYVGTWQDESLYRIYQLP